MTVRRLAPVLLALTVTLPLSACVIKVGPDGDYHSDYSDVEKREARNRDIIGQMELGTSIEAARARLGEPDFSEALNRDGETLRVLRYRTHRAHADGDTTIDETTVLVFVDGELAGIGETAWRALIAP